MAQVQASFGPFKSRLIALNVHDAVMRLVEGGCDLLIVYHHSSQPLELDASRYEMVNLGQELLAPYCKPDNLGQPLFPLPGSSERPLPFLAYGPGAYLGRLTELILKEAGVPVHLERAYETDMAEGLKAMALEGLGVAFLPFSAVRDELQNGRLVNAALPGGPRFFTADEFAGLPRKTQSQSQQQRKPGCARPVAFLARAGGRLAFGRINKKNAGLRVFPEENHQ